MNQANLLFDFLNATHGLPISVPVGFFFAWQILGGPFDG